MTCAEVQGVPLSQEGEKPAQGCIWLWYSRTEGAPWYVRYDDGRTFAYAHVEFGGLARTLYRKNGGSFDLPAGPRAILEIIGHVDGFSET